ncbi:MAG: type II toxin-antitoxin system VapC family toxin [Candidatus Asgardarchaeia archaeon]
MQRRNLDFVEGIVDVGIIVIAHVDNPARSEALNFLKKVLLREIRAIIPISAFLGAYYILTKYLKVPRLDAKRSLIRTLEVETPSFHEDIKVENVIDALDYAATYNIESWDGYLISLAKDFNTDIIYSIDENFKKVPGIVLINPISDEKMKEYHKWISNLK